MTTFIESIDIKAVKCVRKNYILSTMSDWDGNIIPRLVNEYSNDEILEFGFNSKAINAIISMN